jgi:hypothetical protein
MLADRALRNTFGNFSTLFLLALLVTVVTHLVYGIVFRDVLEIDELHRFVKGLTAGRTVTGIGAKDLREAIFWAKAVPVAEILLLPLLVGATRRVISRSDRGEVPTVMDGVRHPRSGPRLRAGRVAPGWATVLLGTALAVGVWFLARQTGILLIEPLPDPANFLWFTIVYAVAEALGLAFFLGTFVTAASEDPDL